MTISMIKKIALISAIILTILFTSLLQAEDSMLNKKPYFTYRIETKGALYESKINGIVLEKDTRGNALNFEQPVNQFMRTGKNRIGFQLYTRTPEDFDNAKITASLYVNQDGASESEKKLISQVTFKASDFAQEKNPQQAIQASMPAVKLDSTNAFLASDNGDVIVHTPQIEPSKVRPYAFHIYQDIELETPFPLWGFFKADKLEFPDAWADFSSNVQHYSDTLIKPVYQEYQNVYDIIKSQNIEQLLTIFEERNREYDIALYYPEGTYNDILKKALQGDLGDDNSNLKISPMKFATPSVSDGKEIIRLGNPNIIYFENEEHSLYSKYPIWFYKKDGKWIISR
jgi:hypothetical protein